MTAIEQLQAAIAERRQQLAGLEFALAFLEAPPATIAVPVAELRTVEPATKKPLPPVAPSRPEAEGNRHDERIVERRKRIAALITKHGPQSAAALAEVIDCAKPTVLSSLGHPWFTKADPNNRLSPWTLTESGRRLAEPSGPG